MKKVIRLENMERLETATVEGDFYHNTVKVTKMAEKEAVIKVINAKGEIVKKEYVENVAAIEVEHKSAHFGEESYVQITVTQVIEKKIYG